MRYFGIACVMAGILILISCNKDAKQEKAAFKSMEQIYAEEGIPVRTRILQKSLFSTYLKYPAQLRAKIESTASASITEVVREVFVAVGDSVEKDQTLVTFSKSNPIFQQAKLSLENAEANYLRSKDLFDNKGISQQAFENAKNAYEFAQSAFKSADDMIHVKAPISGVVTSLKVQVSSNVKPGDELFTVSNLDQMEATLWVGAPEIGKIRLGQPARLKWQDQVLSGTVSRLSLIMDTEQKAFQVLVEFPNPRRLLTSGLTADVEIETYRSPQAVVVRRTEVVREGDSYLAFVENNGFAARRKLEIQAEEGFNLEIRSGLEPGDRLITESLHLLSDGVKIKNVR
ncbi:MAG: efflux RND transporter periplasmic adaptor subunit [Termitinemataceae bacterium]